ncbi:MAG: hypothetical protein ACPGD8_07575, partial [Flavobacteriales bacterium]
MKASKILMIIGALLPASLFFVPMWTIELSAPQYPEPLGMEIWINKIADMKTGDLQNINLGAYNTTESKTMQASYYQFSISAALTDLEKATLMQVESQNQKFN